jgi:hypothetical protein
MRGRRERLGHTVVAASEGKDLKQLPKHHNLESTSVNKSKGKEWARADRARPLQFLSCRRRQASASD